MLFYVRVIPACHGVESSGQAVDAGHISVAPVPVDEEHRSQYRLPAFAKRSIDLPGLALTVRPTSRPPRRSNRLCDFSIVDDEKQRGNA